MALYEILLIYLKSILKSGIWLIKLFDYYTSDFISYIGVYNSSIMYLHKYVGIGILLDFNVRTVAQTPSIKSTPGVIERNQYYYVSPVLPTSPMDSTKLPGMC